MSTILTIHLVDELLDLVSEKGEVEPDVDELVAAHDGLGVLPPALAQRPAVRATAPELQQILLLLNRCHCSMNCSKFIYFSYLKVMRRTLVHGDVNMVHDSLLQDLFRLVQAVFCTTIVVLVLGQYVDITINEGTLQ